MINAHQRQRRNTYLNSRRRNKREDNCQNSFTSATPPPGFRIMQQKVTFIDLFPNITEELREEIAERKRLWNAYKLDPENLEEPPKSNMWAVGWRKGYEGLEILGQYCHQKAIDANFDSDSVLAGEVVFKIFYGFGDVAVKKNQFPGDKSPFGFASNLAFSSHGFYNHHHKDDGDASELPLAFALIIPTSRLTGKIATHHDGYDVVDGQFIFRDIQVALDFQPNTICRMIFWAQEYVHGTLYPTEPSFFTKLRLSLQVATKASNVCKKYLNGEYDDDSDKYFGGVDELLGN
ncbi:hypothetical protein PSTT_00363 [Puccinia striiformis]|uniref:Tet-like 2OG-Fe(II) oxygenase domain-containing protein n=1 Tax=Puccinia striiformis TaxID=27350 RepID=A0A2S4W761_9BASI|nr:hypothetical protein PSTT_00363 [Puccinia striiformis]